jgi:hypothetical protein
MTRRGVDTAREFETSLPRCETCKWWGSTEPGYASYGDRKMCALTYNADDFPEAGRSLANVFDDEYAWAGLWTSPEFGCVQHEPREDTTS